MSPRTLTDPSFLPDWAHERHARRWLMLGVVSLAVAGLFAIILVIARTPQLAQMQLFARLFHESLVVHVDLSVLVWFLCLFCLLLHLASHPRGGGEAHVLGTMLSPAAYISVALGTAAIALSPLDSNATAIMSNYIPVITSPLFFWGLGMLTCGALLMLARIGISRPRIHETLWLCAAYAAISMTVALVCFVLTFMQLPRDLPAQEYFEQLFWYGGHALQVTHTIVLIAAWATLWKQLTQTPLLSPRLLHLLLAVTCAISAYCVIPVIQGQGGLEEWRAMATLGMRHLGTPIGLLMIWMAWRTPMLWRAAKGQRVLLAGLVASWGMFVYGGVLGLAISGENVGVPAHYHGSIVGITIALMTLAYALLPRLGWRDVSQLRIAFWQPIVLGVGQLMHISGLAWSGGYGVLRKTPAAQMEGLSSVKIALGFMGLGGLLAIIGGLMFVYVCYWSMKKLQPR